MRPRDCPGTPPPKARRSAPGPARDPGRSGPPAHRRRPRASASPLQADPVRSSDPPRAFLEQAGPLEELSFGVLHLEPQQLEILETLLDRNPRARHTRGVG